MGKDNAMTNEFKGSTSDYLMKIYEALSIFLDTTRTS